MKELQIVPVIFLVLSVHQAHFECREQIASADEQRLLSTSVLAIVLVRDLVADLLYIEKISSSLVVSL